MYYFPVLNKNHMDLYKLVLKDARFEKQVGSRSIDDLKLSFVPKDEEVACEVPFYGNDLLPWDIVSTLAQSTRDTYCIKGREGDYIIPIPTLSTAYGFRAMARGTLYYHLLYQMADETMQDEFFDLAHFVNRKGAFQTVIDSFEQTGFCPWKQKDKNVLPSFVEPVLVKSLPVVRLATFTKKERMYTWNRYWNDYLSLAKQNGDIIYPELIDTIPPVEQEVDQAAFQKILK